jgi:hypothetical protein
VIDFYKRRGATHVDGSRVFKEREDTQREAEVARRLERAWGCTLHPYAGLSVIDWWAEKQERVSAFLELKCRSHESTKHSTVFLNHRKWVALSLSQLSGTMAIFVVRFTDQIRWVKLNDVDPSRLSIGGLIRKHHSDNDIEPVIEVPVSTMHILPEG